MIIRSYVKSSSNSRPSDIQQPIDAKILDNNSNKGYYVSNHKWSEPWSRYYNHDLKAYEQPSSGKSWTWYNDRWWKWYGDDWYTQWLIYNGNHEAIAFTWYSWDEWRSDSY